jgi:hypothetical protein
MQRILIVLQASSEMSFANVLVCNVLNKFLGRYCRQAVRAWPPNSGGIPSPNFKLRAFDPILTWCRYLAYPTRADNGSVGHGSMGQMGHESWVNA